MLNRFLFLFFISFSLFAEPYYEFNNNEDEKRFFSLIKEIRCPKCTSGSLASSNAPVSEDLKKVIAEMIEDGQSDEDIKNFISDRFGKETLYDTPREPNTYALWYSPFVFLLICLVFFFLEKNHNGYICISNYFWIFAFWSIPPCTKNKNKGLVLGFSFFYLLSCLFIFTGSFYTSSSYSLKTVNQKIIQKIALDIPIEKSLYQELFQYPNNKLTKNWVQSYLLNAISLNHFNSAESLISIAEDIYSEPREKVIFYSMYTQLRDARFPLFSSARLDISSTLPINCANKNSSKVRLDIVDGPGVPIAEGSFIDTNEYSLSNKNSLIPGFDIASALLNNESLEIFIELSCLDIGEIYQFNSLFIFDPNSPVNTYKISSNEWSKAEQ